MLRSRYVGALAPLLLVLSGCGSAEPDAAPPPKVSASPTPTPSTPPAPVMPEAAKADTKAGAVAFVKWYVELINHAQATGDVEALRASSAPECEPCRKVGRRLEGIYGEGGHIEGGAWTVRGVEASRSDDGWLAAVAISASPQTVVKTTTQKFPGGQHTYELRLRLVTKPEVMAWSRIG